MKKKINISLIILIVVFNLLGILLFGEKPMAENAELRLILKTDKEIYQVGDNIILTYSFFNNNAKPVYLLPWGGEYAINWISAFDSNGKISISMPLVFRNIKFIPSRKDFVLIEPNREYTISIKGKIVDKEMSKFNRESSKKYKGIFLDFEDSAIFMGKVGFFDLKAFYSGKGEWAQIGKANCQLVNVFTGELESNKVKIMIQK